MSGVYIHIPFCASRCAYCGFYSTTLGGAVMERYVRAVCREARMRADYPGGDGSIDTTVSTIYVGGGTPSLLAIDHIAQLLDAVGTSFRCEVSEITVEMNPDDVAFDYVAGLRRIGVNRISMGVQTFDDAQLRQLGRRHTARQAVAAVDIVRRAGIDNVSIDLMFALPGQSLRDVRADVDRALSLDVEHISTYSLMYEEDTPLWKSVDRKEILPVSDEISAAMYDDIVLRLERAGYEHYEISNFARPGRRSQHNSGYWDGTHYVGLGAAAHSFCGTSRQWNVADAGEYIKQIERGCVPAEREVIDERTRYNDLITTALRTSDGLPLAMLTEAQRRYVLGEARRYVDGGLMELSDDRLRIAHGSFFVSDGIMASLILPDDD